jgi:hypothetical protein
MMECITDFNESTSEYELFSFLYDKVIHRKITTFAKLKEETSHILSDKRTQSAVMRLFNLIRQLNWGLFADMERTVHTKLWKEMIIQDKHFPDAGDIKRTLTISNLFVCMLDIHGYTKFCQDSKKNVSMLHTLDRTINTEIKQIAANCGCVCQRERGDEIVVVAASAADAITVTLAIMDYFAGTKVIQNPAIAVRRQGESAALPAFKLSAGISGGNTSVPLIITQQGNLSGFLLNTGARLQSRANTLSPKESRIMITRQVAIKFDKENTSFPNPIHKHVFFFDTGSIEFKGVLLPTCEVLFNPKDRYKKSYEEEQKKLFDSIRNNLWENRIYVDMMNMLSKISTLIPPFTLNLKTPLHGFESVTNDTLDQLCRLGVRTYVQNENYTFSVGLLHDLITLIEKIPFIDKMVLDYLEGITERYTMVLDGYHKIVEERIQQQAEHIFPGENYKRFLTAKNNAGIYDKYLLTARKNHTEIMRRPIWNEIIRKYDADLKFTLYSGKK